MSELITPAAEALARVPAGATVGIAGASGIRRPLALARELARQGRTDLRLVGWADGPEAGLIGCAPLTVVPAHAFRAAALGVDFIPGERLTAGAGGVVSPVSGERFAVIEAVAPDVVLLHADAADEDGNVLLVDDPDVWRNDGDLVAAGRTVIVSVERLVSRLTTADSPRDRIVAGSHVAAVVHAPFGAHPLAYPGRYAADDAPAIAPAADHWAYLDQAGISRLIFRSTTRQGHTQ
jgi:glutaconate CoA-transferase subunit A